MRTISRACLGASESHHNKNKVGTSRICVHSKPSESDAHEIKCEKNDSLS